MKRICLFVLAMALLVGLVGCGQKSDEDKDATSNMPPNLTGEWKQINSNSEDSYQEATITGDVIEIYWVYNGGDTKALYWSGTFIEPTTSDEPYSWVSKNDHEKTDLALLASGDDTKKFTYEDAQISYSASALETTTIVRLEKLQDEVKETVSNVGQGESHSENSVNGWSPEDFSFYNDNGDEKAFTTTNENYIMLSSYESLFTYRGIEIGDRATTALEKYEIPYGAAYGSNQDMFEYNENVDLNKEIKDYAKRNNEEFAIILGFDEEFNSVNVYDIIQSDTPIQDMWLFGFIIEDEKISDIWISKW